LDDLPEAVQMTYTYKQLKNEIVFWYAAGGSLTSDPGWLNSIPGERGAPPNAVRR